MKPSDYAKQYANKYPEIPTSTLARKLFNENPGVFESEGTARQSIRYVRGQRSGGQTKSGLCKVTPNPIKCAPIGAVNQYTLPVGIRQGHTPVNIKGPRKILIISDMHVPYHSEKALDLAIEDGMKFGCDTIYLNGDQLDFYQLSRFVRDPKMRRPKQERDTLWEIMDVLEKLFPYKFWKKANHEVRWDVALFTQAKEFCEFEEFSLQSILDLDARGWVFVDSVQRCTMGALNAFHGHEVGKGTFAPVYPARALFMRIKDSGFAGHWHQSSQYTDTRPLSNDEHRTQSTWIIGCTCDLEPDYAPINNWNHGHALVDLHEDGSFEFHNRRHIGKKVYPA